MTKVNIKTGITNNNTTMRTATKMYLSIILSMVCIMFYQYQLSKANFITWQGGDGNTNSGIIAQNRNGIDTNEVLFKINSRKSIPNAKSKIETETETGTDGTEKMNANANIKSIDKESEIDDENLIDSSFDLNVNANANAKANTKTTETRNAKTSTGQGHATDPKNKNDDGGSNQLPPPLYIITPTFRRPEQIAEITRLGHTLKHIPNLFWLVVEDASTPTALVTKQLQRLGIPFAHLTAPMPNRFKKRTVKPRGVSNRNRGLAWIRKNATDGVFYFADDDNTYDLEIFHQMRYTKKVSMWPVGLVTKFGVSSPIVRDGRLAGYYDGWIGGRRYPVDMAGFAVNVKFFLSRPKAIMPYDAGYEEDKFLRSLSPFNDTEIEFLASNCTEILTWHTQTKKNAPATPLDMKKYNGTNLVALRQVMV